MSPWFLALLAVTLAGGFLAASATSRSVLTTGIVLLMLGGWAVSLCLHEFAHAYTAYRGGDRSVRAKGYLTLDIRRYADIGLSLVLPMFFLLLGGIPLPGGAVWIDHGAIRREAHLDGKWLLRTSDLTLTPDDLAAAYKQLLAVEWASPRSVETSLLRRSDGQVPQV